MQEIEVLIICAGTSYVYEASTFLSSMTGEGCLSRTCTTVIRMPFELEMGFALMKSSQWLDELDVSSKRKKKRQQKSGRNTCK